LRFCDSQQPSLPYRGMFSDASLLESQIASLTPVSVVLPSSRSKARSQRSEVRKQTAVGSRQEALNGKQCARSEDSRLCSSTLRKALPFRQGSLIQFEAAPRNSAAEPQIHNTSATVSQRLTAMVLRQSRTEKGSNWPFAADCEFRNGRARVVRNSLHHETLSILSIVIGPDSVSGCAFVGRLSGP